MECNSMATIYNLTTIAKCACCTTTYEYKIFDLKFAVHRPVGFAKLEHRSTASMLSVWLLQYYRSVISPIYGGPQLPFTSNIERKNWHFSLRWHMHPVYYREAYQLQ